MQPTKIIMLSCFSVVIAAKESGDISAPFILVLCTDDTVTSSSSAVKAIRCRNFAAFQVLYSWCHAPPRTAIVRETLPLFVLRLNVVIECPSGGKKNFPT